MSLRTAADFFAKVAEDEALAARITGTERRQRVTSAVELARNEGFEFTEAECNELLAMAQKGQTSELSDDALEQVAGGATSFQIVLGTIWKAVGDLMGANDDPPDDSQIPNSVAGVRG